MPPKITRVRWSAQNVPWGLSFNEKTGTFTGTPEDIGEYVVPVTVETNYGTDTEDVKIIVGLPTYNVYSIGLNAATWANGNEPDEDGFYGLSMPKANKLVSHYEGFGAITADKEYYCCGVHDITSVTSINLVMPQFLTVKTPTIFRDYSTAPITRVICGNYSYSNYTGGTNGGTATRQYSKWIMYWMESKGNGICKKSGILQYKTVTSNGQTQSSTSNPEQFNSGFYVTNSTSSKDPSGDDISDGISVFGDAVLSSASSPTKFVGLNRNGMQCYSGTSSIIKLQEKSIKIFSSRRPFLCLTESGYLYNYNATNLISCSYGLIKNAWEAGETAFYVQTKNNLLCQYIKDTQDWDLLGAFDIKKVEVPNVNMAFLLTNNGELYHKGNAVSGVTEAHDNFTHIFTNLNFADFTFGGNTLTVLKE